MVEHEEYDASRFTRFLRALPRKRLLFILLVVLVNAYVRCYFVWRRDVLFSTHFCTNGPLCPVCGVWTFTRDEWLDVVWPWR